MQGNVIQLGELRRYNVARQAVTARARSLGATAERTAGAIAIAILALQQGRSTGAAVALANSSLGGPRNLRLITPGGAA